MKLIKLILISIVIIPIILIVSLALLWLADYYLLLTKAPVKTDFGITYSVVYAQNLGLDPIKTYQEILSDLQVNRVRIPIYWDMVEPSKGYFNFETFDQLLDLSQADNTQVVLALGYKVPRWPECFQPGFAKSLTKIDHQAAVLSMLQTTVEHYKNRPEIISWQIENEPTFPFGPCETVEDTFLVDEVKLIRSLSNKPIIITDSGEMSSWVTPALYSDELGISLYRTTWHPIFGYFQYPFPPLLYNLRAKLTQFLFNTRLQKVFITELQAEPWAPGTPLPQTDINEQIKIFNLDKFKDNVIFADRTNLSPVYLWGTEWWYWMKLRGHNEYWEYAKTLF